jgi:hypothetical protein
LHLHDLQGKEANGVRRRVLRLLISRILKLQQRTLLLLLHRHRRIAFICVVMHERSISFELSL